MPPLKGMAVSSELSTNIAIVRWVYLIQYTPQLVIPQQSPLYPIKSPYIHNVLHINIHSIYILYRIFAVYIHIDPTLIPHICVYSRWIIIPTWPWQRNTVAPGSTFCVARLLSTSRGDATVANQVIKDIRPWAVAHQSWARISGCLCS